MRRLVPLTLVMLLLAACSTHTAPQPTPDPSSSSIEVSAASAQVGDAVKVTVTLKDTDGGPVATAGHAVRFSATGGTLHADADPALTQQAVGSDLVVTSGTGGSVSAYLRSTTATTITVTARLGSDTSGGSVGAITVTFDATGGENPDDENPDDEEPADEEPIPSAQNSTITASADRSVTGSVETITIQLHDQDGDVLALAGETVTFGIHVGSLSSDGTTFAAVGESLTLVTGPTGTATAYVTSDVDGSVSVSGHLGSSTSSPDIGTAEVTFGSIALNDLLVTYDGEAHSPVATFSDPAAADGASYQFVRVGDDDVLDAAPSAVGVYDVTITPGGDFPGSATAKLTILPRDLSFVAPATFADKAYDGGSSTTVTVTLDTADVVIGDDVALSEFTTGEFQAFVDGEWVASSAVGAYLDDEATRVLAMASLSGEDAQNYTIPQATGSAEITRRAVAFSSGVSVADKEYDGTNRAEVTGAFDPAPLAEEDVAFEAVFVSPAVGTDVAVTVTLTGNDAGNYTLAPLDLTADITARALTITATDQTKVYGDTLDLGTAAFTAEGLVDDEGIASVVLASAGAAADSNADSYPVTASAAVAADGTHLSNYSISYEAGTLTVTARGVVVTPSEEQDKTYGEDDPVFTYTTAGLVNGADLTGSLGRVAGEDVGSYEFTLGTLATDDGNEGLNYSLALVEEPTQFAITTRELVVTPVAEQSKTYGDPDPVFTYTVTGGALVDDHEFTGAMGREEGSAVGAYAYTVGDLSVADGNEGANYSLSVGGSETFTIGVRTVTVAGELVVTDRPYDGTLTAEVDSLELVLVNAVEGDDVALLPVVAFADRHVAEDKPVTLTAETSLVGEDAPNYLLDLTDAPSSTATISKAEITFDVTNKDSLTYTGLPLGLVVTTDPAPAPSTEPVSYTLQYRRVLTPAGEEIDEGVSAIRAAGQYRVTVSSTDPRYEGSDGIIVTVSARPITLTATVAGKTYGEADPALPPQLQTGSTLGAGDSLTGFLGYSGADAGSYDLMLGTVTVNRSGADASANYAITISGTFTVQPAPVSFDIANADYTVDGVHVFERDGSTIVGLEVLSDPTDMTDYLLSYRRTHDQNHQAIPAVQQAVSAMEALGTYVVTIASANPNYAGSTDLVVWLTDGIDLAALGEGGEALAPTVLLGSTWSGAIPFLNADGAQRSLGPLPVTFDLSVAPLSGLMFLDPVTGDPITSVTVPAGATDLPFDVKIDSFQATPYTVTVTPSGPLAGAISGFSFQVQPQVELVVLGDDVELGEDAYSSAIVVQLQDANGLPVVAPFDVSLALDGSAGLEFIASGSDAVVTDVTVPSGSTSASFRVRAAAAGDYQFHVENGSAVPGIVMSDARSVTINPKPTVSSLSLASLEIGQTLDLVITGADFAAGAEVTLGGGLTVGPVVVDSASQLTVTVTAGIAATAGEIAVTVTNPDGGTATLSAGLSLVKPTLTAGDDLVNIVEDGSIDLAKSSLLGNDVSSSGIDFGIIGFGTAVNVTVVDNGSTLRVTSTGLKEEGASFNYTIADELGTESTATVTFNITLPPQDAVVFTDRADLEAYTAGYEPPTFQEVFDTWPRASNNNYYPDPSLPMGGSAGDWTYNAVTDRIVMPSNTGAHEIIVSPESEALEFYELEATLSSSDTDDDSIGLVIAFVRDGGYNKYLVAHRTRGGTVPRAGWGITYFDGTGMRELTNVSVGSMSGGWSGNSSRVRVVRNGDTITASTTAWGNLTTFSSPMEIDLDASTINGVAAGYDLSVFKGAMQYGYHTYSQAYSTYIDISITGGLALDFAYLLTNGSDTDDVAGNDVWTGSETWQFNEATLAWEIQAGRTIQDDLRFPRIVTSVAPSDPADPNSPAVGTRFEIRENEVRLLNLP